MNFLVLQFLSGLFKKLVKISPEMSVSFVHSLMTRTLGSLQSMSFSDVEVALALFFTLGDTLTGLDGKSCNENLIKERLLTPFLLYSENTKNTMNHFLSEMTSALVTSGIFPKPFLCPATKYPPVVCNADVWSYNHKAVLMSAMDIVVRYARFLPSSSTVYPTLLSAFFGPRCEKLVLFAR